MELYIKCLVTVFLLLLRRCNCSRPDFGSKAKVSCDGTSFYKQTTLSWPNHKADCTYKFKAHSWFVCQIRVDFDIDLAPPTMPTNASYMECVDDYLQIGSHKFCGKDKQQHAYISFNRTAGEKEISLRLYIADRSLNRVLAPATWNIKVTQLECSLGSPLRSFSSRTWFSSIIQPKTFFNDGFWIAPTGCLQYYPHAEGVITSFNYNDGLGIYPGNRNYAICFRRTTATNSLQLTSNYFKMPPNLEQQFDGLCRSQIEMPVGVDDYLSIPDARVSQTGVRASLFCGIISPGTIITSTSLGPFALLFHSAPRHEEPGKYGFSFNYKVM